MQSVLVEAFCTAAIHSVYHVAPKPLFRLVAQGLSPRFAYALASYLGWEVSKGQNGRQQLNVYSCPVLGTGEHDDRSRLSEQLLFSQLSATVVTRKPVTVNQWN